MTKFGAVSVVRGVVPHYKMWRYACSQ